MVSQLDRNVCIRLFVVILLASSLRTHFFFLVAEFCWGCFRLLCLLVLFSRSVDELQCIQHSRDGHDLPSAISVNLVSSGLLHGRSAAGFLLGSFRTVFTTFWSRMTLFGSLLWHGPKHRGYESVWPGTGHNSPGELDLGVNSGRAGF
jgi:hypothetical protein